MHYEAHTEIYLHFQESFHESTLTSEDSLESPTQSVSQQYPVRCVVRGDDATIWIVLQCAADIVMYFLCNNLF